MKTWSDNPMLGCQRTCLDNGPGRQPVSSSTSRAAASGSDSPASTPPAGSSQPQLSVMNRCRPQQQHPSRRVVHHGPDRLPGQAHHVVAEAHTARHLDVDQPQPDPVALVQRPLPVHRPPHAETVGGAPPPTAKPESLGETRDARQADAALAAPQVLIMVCAAGRSPG